MCDADNMADLADLLESQPGLGTEIVAVIAAGHELSMAADAARPTCLCPNCCKRLLAAGDSWRRAIDKYRKTLGG